MVFLGIATVGAASLHAQSFDSWARNELAHNKVRQHEVSDMSQLKGTLRQMEEKLYETNSL
jgi:hypothetical protein